MKKNMTVFYEVYGNLYVNLTNECPCSCKFCLRQTNDHVGSADSLWLEHNPDMEEILGQLEKQDLGKYKEVVFCGFGEPTQALENLIATAKKIREISDLKIRVNTNGLGNLINEKDITPLFKDLVDTVSISLNTPDPEKYFELVRPRFGRQSFDEMLKFAGSCTKYVPNVVMTTVETTLTHEEEEECRKICEKLGAKYRIREWIN